MDVKTMIVGYGVLAIISSTLFLTLMIANPVIYSEKLVPTHADLSVIYSRDEQRLLIAKYYVFYIGEADPYLKHELVIGFKIIDYDEARYFIKDVRIYVNTTTRINPLRPPGKFLYFDDFLEYIEKLNPISISGSLADKTYEIHDIVGDYLMIMVVYHVVPDITIDLAKHVPPITYYPPYPPPSINTLYNYVSRAFNETYYRIMIDYFFNDLLNRHVNLEFKINYFLSRESISSAELGMMWALLIVFTVLYDAGSFIAFIKSLPYKTLSSLQRIVQALKRLRIYIVGQHSVSPRRET